jgi:hypothetical protein
MNQQRTTSGYARSETTEPLAVATARGLLKSVDTELGVKLSALTMSAEVDVELSLSTACPTELSTSIASIDTRDAEDEEEEGIFPSILGISSVAVQEKRRSPCQIRAEGECSKAASPKWKSGDVLSCFTKPGDCTADYSQPSQTIIIFDWDDTLCPSSYLQEKHGLSVDGTSFEELLAKGLVHEDVAEELENYMAELGALLALSKELASKVVVVTNASDGWVEDCVESWMPQLKRALEHVEISSARSTWEPKGVGSPTSWKTREFEALIEDFYSRQEQKAWKNVIVVGDAPYEHEALQRVVNRVPKTRSFKCRSKSVNFAYKPSIEELSSEVQTLRSHLRTIINYDGNLNCTVSLEQPAVILMTPPGSPGGSSNNGLMKDDIHGEEVASEEIFFQLTIE